MTLDDFELTRHKGYTVICVHLFLSLAGRRSRSEESVKTEIAKRP
jgi:hypothetical protein